MKRFFHKYFLETPNYGISFFLSSMVLIAAGWAIHWALKLGTTGGIIFFVLYIFLFWNMYNDWKKSLNKRANKK